MGNICDKSEKRFENLHSINFSSQIKNLDILSGKEREKYQVIFLKDRKTCHICPLLTLKSNLPQSKVGKSIWKNKNKVTINEK